MSSSNKMNSVFYAESYHPIQAGSIDGTDILPHDNAVYRAHLCSAAGLYDPFGDPKVIGDPYCTLFVGRLSDQTDEESLRKAMSKYGRVKNLQLVRHIVTGAPRGYAFVEYETDREMRHAYEDAHHSIIDGNEIIVDYYRQQLMPGWIPRRLGGGLGGKKESGQLRFGGRERPFRAPLRPIPYDDLKRLGIPPPPEGQYMPRFKIPSPPRRRSSHTSREDSRHRTPEDRRSSRTNREDSPSTSRHRRSEDKRSRTIREGSHSTSRHRRSEDRRRSTHTIRADSRSPSRHRKSERQRSNYGSTEDSSSKHKRSEDSEHRPMRRRTPSERDVPSHKQDRHHREHSHRYYKESSSTREYSPHRHKKKRSRSREHSP